MDRDFTRLRAKDKALDADEVAQVQQFLEDHVVQVLVLVRAEIVAGDIDLYPALRVQQFCETGFSHDAAAHHAASHTHLPGLRSILLEMLFYLPRISVDGIFSCGIRVDTHLA